MNARTENDQVARGKLRRCVVHIGLNKTGSTTIQGWLAANGDLLERQGIRYDTFEGGRTSMTHAVGFSSLGVHMDGRPVPADHVRAHLKIADMNDQTRLVEDFIARAEASIARPGYRSYVISSEFLPSWLGRPERTAQFHDWLRARFDRVLYVVYVRDQVDWVPSAYAQMIKMGGTRSLEDYLELRGTRNYLKICRNWAQGTPGSRLDVRLLDRETLVNGDLVADFASVIGANVAQTRPARILNEAYSADALQKLRHANRMAEKMPGGLMRNMRNIYAYRFVGTGSGEKLRLTPEQALDVARRNRDTNEKFRQRYFPDRPVLFPKAHKLLAEAGDLVAEQDST